MTDEKVEITLNGTRRSIPQKWTIARLLQDLELNRGQVAVELNRTIIKRAEWDQTRIQTGDSLEVVHFVGGGERQP